MSQHIKQLLISDFLEQRKQGVVIDVRTPAEYAKGHVPESINVPLFSNAERILIGTTFKQIGREEAVLQGLQLIGPRMADIVLQVKAIAIDKPIYIYCWRGGMRSGSVAWLLQTTGMQVRQLVGGYKAYRNHFYKLLSTKPWQLIVLGGRTGSGKTEILNHLAAKGQQVIDLEKIACHKGSAFGGLGQLPQPTTEHFENLLHESFLRADPSKPIWVEGESQRIGFCFIPMQFYTMMQSALYINVVVPASQRVERLVKDYAHFPKAKLTEAVMNIKKRLGGLGFQQALEAIEASDFHRVAQLSLAYYDKTYDYCYTERSSDKMALELETSNVEEIADFLLKTIDEKRTTAPNQ